jgi:peptide/nickel transport system permease protein
MPAVPLGMLRFVLRRVLTAIPSLLGLLVITFLLIRVVPADPAAALAGDNATPQQIEAIRHQYGFDRPIFEQLYLYLGQVLRFDFGESQYSRRPVGLDLRQRLPATLELTFAALLLATGLGIPLGVVAAIYHNRWPDFVLRIASVTGIAVAAFWFAITLQLIFAMQLEWLPLRGELSSGIVPPPAVTGSLILDALIAGRWGVFADALRHLVLPTVTLSVGALATIMRFTRAGVLETMQKDFVLYERAVGYPRRRLIWVYVLRNSVIAAVTQIGLLFGALIGGAVVVEAIFDWPGVGNYLVSAILTADYKVMLAATMLIGVVYTIVNILTDLVHGWLDPRLWEQL